MDLNQNNAESWFNRGYALMQNGRVGEAIEAYQRAIAVRSDYPQAWNNLGHALLQSGNVSAAIHSFQQALALRPGHVQTQYGLARALRLAGRRREAIDLLEQSLSLQPDFPPALDELSALLADESRDDEAIAALQRLCTLQPNIPEAHNRLGALLADRDVDEAIARFQQALSVRPDYAEATSNLGLALAQAGRLDEAEAAHRKALQIAPAYAEARWNLALLQLQRGSYDEGWKNYESRRERVPSVIHRSLAGPMWDGSDLNGRRILLHSEQGFGDTIQFVRYAPLVAERGGKVVLSCQPQLLRLLKTVERVEQVISTSDPLPEFDVQCPLGTLPLRFGTTVSTIPSNVPYLFADPGQVANTRERLSREPGKLKVGIAWAGNPARAKNSQRSIDPQLLRPLSQIPQVTLVSLQKGSAISGSASALDQLPEVVDWTGDLHDFADTAALVCALDLVVTVDTAVAHLAGALGRPVWLMLSAAGDWRYLFDREDSPWYQTMRIFRQPKFGDWKSAVAKIAGELTLRQNQNALR